MKLRAVSLSALVLSLVAPSLLAQFWEKKVWKEWSNGEAKKILEDSPWARKWTQGETREVAFGQPSGGTGREDRPTVYYIVQFRSARPVREGVLREVQLSSQFQNLSEADKKNFESQADAFRNKNYDDVILIHVLYGSNVQIYEREMARFWQGFPQNTVPMNCSLISSSNVRVAPFRLVSPQTGAYEFELIFPRRVNGELWIKPDDKKIRVEFPHPNVGIGGARVFIEFDLEKMKWNGQLEY
jgi:hypothetical protein